jgi:hypothetical protein
VPKNPHSPERPALQLEKLRLPNWKDFVAQRKPEETKSGRPRPTGARGNRFHYGNNGFYIFGGSKRNADSLCKSFQRQPRFSPVRRRYTACRFPRRWRFSSLQVSGDVGAAAPIYERIHLGLQNVTFVDIHAELLNRNHKYLYYRTDHHWTPLGCLRGI